MSNAIPVAVRCSNHEPRREEGRDGCVASSCSPSVPSASQLGAPTPSHASASLVARGPSAAHLSAPLTPCASPPCVSPPAPAGPCTPSSPSAPPSSPWPSSPPAPPSASPPTPCADTASASGASEATGPLRSGPSQPSFKADCGDVSALWRLAECGRTRERRREWHFCE